MVTKQSRMDFVWTLVLGWIEVRETCSVLAVGEAGPDAVGYHECAKRLVKDTLLTPVFLSELQRAHRLMHVHERIGILTLAHTGSTIVSDDVVGLIVSDDVVGLIVSDDVVGLIVSDDVVGLIVSDDVVGLIVR